MLREILYKQTSMPLYSNALDAYAARQRAIASNLANVETPRYEARKVSFEDRLRRALGRVEEPLQSTNSGHMPVTSDPAEVKYLVVKDEADISQNGVNNVDIEKQMTELAVTQMQYDMTARRAQGLFNKMRSLTKLS